MEKKKEEIVELLILNLDFNNLNIQILADLYAQKVECAINEQKILKF